MANLLITVISIMILAAASVVGLYYGGTAYTGMRADAAANTIVTQGTQIAGAWQAWSRDHGGADLSDNYWGDSNGPSDLVPMYLDVFLKPPSLDIYVSDSGIIRSFYFPMNSFLFQNTGAGSTFHTSNSLPIDMIFLQFQTNALSVSICKKLADLAGGIPGENTTANSGAPYYGGNFIPAMTTKPFGCVYRDLNSDGVFNAGDISGFYYKVF